MTTWRKFCASITSNVIGRSQRFIFGATLVAMAGGASQTAMAQNHSLVEKVPDFAPAMIEHMQKMRRYKDHDHGAQPTPRIIPQFSTDVDATGIIASFQTEGRTFTSNNAFFQDLGTNGRTCFSCHQPQEGWTVTPEGVQHRFAKSQGRDPIFRLVDGAVCPTADVSTLAKKQKAYKLLLEKGLIRIPLAIPATAEFVVTAVDDPYGCNTNPDTGLQGPLPTNKGMASVYRRPLPIGNVRFQTAIMWDGRETLVDSVTTPPGKTFNLDTSLRRQALDATLGHAQAKTAPTDEQLDEIVRFQKNMFMAQIFDRKAGSLTSGNVTGGPINLSMTDFFVCINDPFGCEPNERPFNATIFNVFSPWLGSEASGGDDGGGGVILTPELQKVSLSDIFRDRDDDHDRRRREHNRVNEQRRSIARGEIVFNTKKFTIDGVAGINDVLQGPLNNGSCGTCHDTPNVGDHSIAAPLNIGITTAGDQTPPAVDISGLPVFKLRCVSGQFAGQEYTVTDPGRALISGLCKDIGKLKGPMLRGLASRAPYFHNGAAKSLFNVVNFYDQRFKIGFTEQEKTDLVNFLNAL